MIATLLVSVTLFAQAPPQMDLSTAIKNAAKKGANALIMKQNPDGGYGPLIQGKSDVGITALVLWALAESPDKYRDWQTPYVSAAADLLLKHQQKDGSIHDGTLWNYKTSISVMALLALDNDKRYRPHIDKAVAFLKGHQLNEASEQPYFKERHVDWGAWGYGSSMRGDLSNTQFTLEALHEAGIDPDSPLLKRAQVYLKRCQNACDTNDVIVDGMIPKWGTNDDGGFIYRPGEGKSQPVKLQDGTVSYTSYGSMTYAGVKSMIYARMSRDDPCLKKAYQWLCKNYTLACNPGMAIPGKPGSEMQGLFYYYRVMAKAMMAWGEPVIPTPDGKRRWADDLAGKLLSLQKSNGTWVNEVDRWWEGLPEITTAYAILTLQDCAKALKKWPVQGK